MVRQAEGWPAVLALAAAVKDATPVPGILPSTLYRFLAEELLQAASEDIQTQLTTLALLPDMTHRTIEEHLSVNSDNLITQGRDLGFVSGDEKPDLHPLFREFLVQKLSEQPFAEAEKFVRRSSIAFGASAGIVLSGLIERFGLDNLVEPVLRQAFKPLARSRSVGTLSAFAEAVRTAPNFPPPAVDVIGAEVALRDGRLDLAEDLAMRVRAQLSKDDPLRSRADRAIRGRRLFSRRLFSEG